MSKRRKQPASPAATHAALDQLYATLLDVACKGHCVETCSHIPMTSAEHDRIAARGVDIQPSHDPCPALVSGMCSVRDIRPTICRLYGATEAMTCPWGCKPAGGFLPDAAARRALQRAQVISDRAR